MKRNTERGVALVITLIMLALVTFMAVVFLAVSRRERASVTVTGDIITARLMTDAALARAQSEMAARMMATTNPFNYDLIVSTNYYDPAGFRSNNTNAYNVNYERRSNGGLMQAGPSQLQARDWAQNIANLQYDPRPPVFLATNLTGLQTNDFRFYLDLNRNGWFEPTGALTNNDRVASLDFYVGDPQWIGVLERPDRPHSESNRFVGRYAFVVLPAGKSLDLNYIHNDAKRLFNQALNGYHRNQGVGSWEINLAGFLAGLNTNVGAWGPLNLTYNYITNQGVPSSGVAFDDARMILRHRYEGNLSRLASARALLNLPLGPNPFTTNAIDYYSDGPLGPSLTPDPISVAWSGSPNPNGYYDIQELFDTNKTSLPFVQRLVSRSVLPSLYDRYTFYRLLAQLGTDSQVPESNRIYAADYQLHPTNRLHINYQNYTRNGQTNFLTWDLAPASRTAFFTGAADRMLRASLERVVLTNNALRGTNFMLGLTPVRNTFSGTNIQLYHIDAGKAVNLPFYVTNNEYSSATHRLLQLAANIHDATTVRTLGTTNDYPTVFRPVFLKSATNIVISGFIEETNVNFLNFPWMTPEQAMLRGDNEFPRDVPVLGVNLYGVPFVIGAKKGYPNFNKLVVQTLAEVSRRLEIRKTSMGGPPAQTNQMYVISVTNRIGVEGWNSYGRDFNRNLELRVTGQSTFALHHRPEDSIVPYQPRFNLQVFSNTVTMSTWPGSSNALSYIVPVDTNVTRLASSAYMAGSGTFLSVATNVNISLFENSFRVPQWWLRVTNRLQYLLIDRSVRPARIIDFVNLDKLVTEIDLSKGLVGDTNAGGGGIFSDRSRSGSGSRATPVALGPGDMWNAQHVNGDIDAPSQGVLNQIAVSTGVPYTGEGTWRSASGQLQDKDSAIRQFKAFLTGSLTNLTWQVPFTPSRRLYQKSAWEANDPLVHYMAEDLAEPVLPGTTNLLVQPLEGPDVAIAQFIEDDSFLRTMGRRYRPWGGNPSKDPSNDPTAYALTLKDPLIRSSDDWSFPTNKLANLGLLGRVHRGTPWQTMYLKSAVDPRTGQPLDRRTWGEWAGNLATHPTNDWKLLDLFTVAPNDNASRGLLSVNQTNAAAWSAVLSGVSVLTNSAPDVGTGPGRRPQVQEMFVQPGSPQMLYMVEGINRARGQFTNRVYATLGEVLAAPELTVRSPYLNWTSRRQYEHGIDDAAYERIPQQVLSLLRTDEPRVVVYAFGQSLKPAERSLVTVANVRPPIFNLCTNYQITGEFASKAVLRLDPLPPQPVAGGPAAALAQKLRAVVESYTVVQPE